MAHTGSNIWPNGATESQGRLYSRAETESLKVQPTLIVLSPQCELLGGIGAVVGRDAEDD